MRVLADQGVGFRGPGGGSFAYGIQGEGRVGSEGSRHEPPSVWVLRGGDKDVAELPGRNSPEPYKPHAHLGFTIFGVPQTLNHEPYMASPKYENAGRPRPESGCTGCLGRGPDGHDVHSGLGFPDLWGSSF